MSFPPASASAVLGERLVRALARAGSDEQATHGVLRELAAALDARLAILWLLDNETGVLRVADDWAIGDEVLDLRRVGRRLTFAPGVGLPGRVLDTLVAASVDDVGADPDFPRADIALEAGLRSVVAAPLLSPDGPLGVLELFGQTPGVLVQRLDDVRRAGVQLGSYLGRRRIEQRLRASEESSASIVGAALDCIVTMDHRGRVIDFNPAAERTFGYERDETIGELLADLIIPPDLRDAHHRALSEFVLHRRPTILDRRLELTGMRASGSTFPVELTVTRLGTREPPVFVGFLRDITERAAAEEQLARLLEREQAARRRAEEAEHAALEVATVLQRSLLPPRLPEIAGLRIGAAYRAGSEGWAVGGDFYDVFKLARGRWGVAIGDVCGKGPGAAALTAMLRYGLRDSAVRENCPSDVLRAVNAELLRSAEGDFVTAIFATIDVAGAEPEVCLAVAGHPLPLLRDADGAVVPVGRLGGLLGVFPEAEVHDAGLRLRAGQTLLLYTDGATEAATAEGRLGEAGLARVLAASGATDPQATVDEIDAAILASRLPGAADDLALLAISAA
jgi:PAS domain S-box-containing protein